MLKYTILQRDHFIVWMDDFLYNTDMNNKTDSTQALELEWHLLEFRYQSLRIHTKAATRRFMQSIDEHGLLTPITVIASGLSTTPWIVIDGYLRIAAVKALGHDLIAATKWDIELPEALLQAYCYNASRPWIPLEEANLIQELIALHDYTQDQLAKRLGKSASWICRRLQLLHDLPDFVQEAIYKNTVSTWSASRVLIPLARANPTHAKQFVDYLSSKKHSSRDIQSFYEHYLRANRAVRTQIAANPSLFFKPQQLTKLESQGQYDKLAPEYLWGSKITQMNACLKVLKSIAPAVFYPQQDPREKGDFLNSLTQLLSKIESLQHALWRSTNASTPNKTDSSAIT